MIFVLRAFLLPFVGALVGYCYGLSLVHQGKASSFSYSMPLLRIAAIALLGLILLHWGTIPFILFLSSFIFALWLVILTHGE